MRSKMESLAGILSKHDDLKQELKMLSPLKLSLLKDMIPVELKYTIKRESVIGYITSEVIK